MLLLLLLTMMVMATVLLSNDMASKVQLLGRGFGVWRMARAGGADAS